MPDRRVEIYQGKRGLFTRNQWHARIVGGNGFDELFRSSEGYNNRQAIIDLCQDLFPGMPLMVEDRTSMYRWHRVG